MKLPPGKGLGSPRRRTRGRNAKKELDAEAAKEGDAKAEKATEAAKGAGGVCRTMPEPFVALGASLLAADDVRGAVLQEVPAAALCQLKAR